MTEYEAINSISSRLDKFRWASRQKCHFRCPVCGDSKKDPNKTRGAFVLMDNEHYNFSCFNCGASMSFRKFLMEFDPDEYRRFRLKSKKVEESFNMASQTEKKEPVKTIFDDSMFSGVTPILELGRDHPARKYLSGRKLPRSHVEGLYYTDNFNRWSNTVFPEKELKEEHGKEGVIIPLISKDGVEFGYQCRFLEGKFRYLTIMVDTSFVKSYGMDRYDSERECNMVEGAFDSMFLPNGIASLDGAIHRTAEKLNLPKDKTVLWFDDEPYNKDVMKNKKEAISQGWTVIFYPKDMRQYGKDINKIFENLPRDKALEYINKFEKFNGVRAMAKLALG